MEQAGWKCYFMRKYVDDINVIFEALNPGYRYINGRLRWKQCYQSEDLASGLSQDRINMELFRKVASEQFPTLTFTLDIAEDHPNYKVPM